MKKSTTPVAFEKLCSPQTLTKSPAAAARGPSIYFEKEARGHEEPGPDVQPGTGTTALLIYEKIMAN